MKLHNLFITSVLFLIGCESAPPARNAPDVNELRKQVFDLQRTVGAQAAQIEELSNKMLLLKDRIDNRSDAVPDTLSVTPPTNKMVVAISKDIIPPVVPAKDSEEKLSGGAEKLYHQAVSDSKKSQLVFMERDVEALVRNFRDSPLTNNALYLLAETYFKKGQYQKAAGGFERLYKLFPDGNKAVASLFHLGLCYKKMGQNNEAKEAFQNVMTVYPGSREAAQAEKLLEGGSKEAP